MKKKNKIESKEQTRWSFRFRNSTQSEYLLTTFVIKKVNKKSKLKDWRLHFSDLLIKT